MELGKKIKKLRLKTGLTQEELGKILGTTAQSVSKWETEVTMPDISMLPSLAEVFGVSIDDLFDLTTEQRLNRIENRLDMEGELSIDIYWEYEEFLKTIINDKNYQDRATYLLAYVYWHQMDSLSKKVTKYAKDDILINPNEKKCYWMLSKSENHYVWDWNIRNHSHAIDFYKDVISKNEDSLLAHLYLIDQLIADHRVKEAEECLIKLIKLKENPIIIEVYKAYISLAKYDEKTADSIINSLIKNYPTDSIALFEIAQYYASKAEYDKAIDFYEKSFAYSKRFPRFQDELMGIADIYQIKGEYEKAAETYDRIIKLLKDEWHYTDEIDIQINKEKKQKLLEKANKAK